MSLLAATSGDIASGVVKAEGVDFDGSYDYLSRSTDLVGNVDSKTFTFSAWLYVASSATFCIYENYDAVPTTQFFVHTSSVNCIDINAKNSAGSIILNITATTKCAVNTWNHILISIDMNNVSNRSMYLNDSLCSFSAGTYTNDLINFTNTNSIVGSGLAGNYKAKSRLSNIFLSYDYIDLSIEANRRIFISSDGKPTPTATLKALNPILYLPLKDSATAHINEGTGGNFTANGTFATSNRGANQDNCVASTFDGSADYLSKGLSTIYTKTITVSFNVKPDYTGTYVPISIYDYGSSRELFTVYIAQSGSSAQISVSFKNLSNTTIFSSYKNITGTANLVNRSISMSIDIASAVAKVSVDGIVYSMTIGTNLNQFFEATSRTFEISKYTSQYIKGNIGELYFDTKYIDLATNNPFWDSVENKPIPVRKVIANTGVTPLIAMPLDASNAGKNYGTGGDFTANSAPYVGARGASEFWARSAKFASSYLWKNGGFSIPATKTLSIVLSTYITSTASTFGVMSYVESYNGQNNLSVSFINGYLDIIGNYENVYGSFAFRVKSTNQYTSNAWNTLIMSIDLNSTSTRYFSFNGNTSPSWLKYDVTKSVYPASVCQFYVGSCAGGYHYDTSVSNLNGNESNIYVSIDYIDFSQEVNRLKFIDGLGYPLDLKKQIDAGVIPKPLIYLPFDDTSNLGKNLGTGGDFTVNGTVTAGADFSL